MGLCGQKLGFMWLMTASGQHYGCTIKASDLPLCLTVELNVGGIVAAVLVTLILLGLLIFGVWFAYSRGYFESKYFPVEACWFVIAQAGLKLCPPSPQ